jgi:hypothetical protein
MAKTSARIQLADPLMENIGSFSRRPRLASRNRLKAIRHDDRRLGILVPFSRTGDWPKIDMTPDHNTELLMRYGARLTLQNAGHVF